MADFPVETGETPATECGDLTESYKTFGTTDIYLSVFNPTTGSPPYPAVMLIHGGAFSHGDKCLSNMVSIADNLADQGLVVATINYRLTCDPTAPPQTVDPAMCTGRGTGTSGGGSGVQPVEPLEDAVDALQWLRGGRYNIDPDNVGVLGTSAGGVVASLLAVTGTEGDDRADAASAWSGGYNLLDDNMSSSLKVGALLDCTYSACPDDWEFVSSYQRCCNSGNITAAIPLLLYHGKDDPKIPHQEADDMYAHVDQQGQGLIKEIIVKLNSDAHGSSYWEYLLDIQPGAGHDHLSSNEAEDPTADFHGKFIWKATGDWFKAKLVNP